MLPVYCTEVLFEKNGRISKRPRKTKKQKGQTRWSGGGAGSKPNPSLVSGKDIQLDSDLIDRGEKPYVGAFSSVIKIPKNHHIVAIRAIAKVDQNWKKKDKPWPNLKHQSHLVNARTNKKWNVEKNGKKIVGRIEWASDVKCFNENGLQQNCDPEIMSKFR